VRWPLRGTARGGLGRYVLPAERLLLAREAVAQTQGEVAGDGGITPGRLATSKRDTARDR
jgi:hypothetical protein